MSARVGFTVRHPNVVADAEMIGRLLATAVGIARRARLRARYSRREHRQRGIDPRWFSAFLDGDFDALRDLMEPDPQWRSCSPTPAASER